MHVAANRTLGLVLAGNDGLHQFRYGMFCSVRRTHPRRSVTPARAARSHGPTPLPGISFAFVEDGLDADMFADTLRVLPLSNLAAAL